MNFVPLIFFFFPNPGFGDIAEPMAAPTMGFPHADSTGLSLHNL